jgi:hypothetical protein
VFPLIVEDARKLIAACGGSEEIGAGHGEGGEATLTDEEICFNGIGDQSHEAFYLTRNGKGIMGFTKTARKYYDTVVTALLYRVAFRLQDGRAIGSDGDWEDWNEGRDLVKQVFPNDKLFELWKIEGAEDEQKEEEEKDYEKDKKDEKVQKTTSSAV